MKKRKAFEKISYYFDLILSRSTLSMIVLLFSIMATIVLLLGIVAYFVSDNGGLFYQIWISLMHTIDSGNLSGDSTANIPYLIVMSLATLCGLFVTSVLIGIVTTGFENKLANLRKGTSSVQVKNQTTIIGFNNNIYSLITELIEANRNKKKEYIVILGDAEKEFMESEIFAHIPKTYNTTIVCRSGCLYKAYSFGLCSIENSRSIIVNTDNDSLAIKILLSLSSYLKEIKPLHEKLRYVVSVNQKENIEAARIASDENAIVIHSKDAISRIIANTCRQHGLSQVLTELFNFNGEEMYSESIPELVGKTFRESLLAFSNSTPVGIVSDGVGCLNPPMDTVIQEGDKIVLIEEDDKTYKFASDVVVNKEVILTNPTEEAQKDLLVILGSNDKLPLILSEYDKYVQKGSMVIIVDEDLDIERLTEYENISITVLNKVINRQLLSDFVDNGATNILLLNDDSKNPEDSDSDTLLRLMLLRDISDKSNKLFNITTEMHFAENKELATRAN